MTTLYTSRLILRNFSQDDLDDLYEYLSDEETVRYEPYRPMTMEQTRDNLSWRISTDEMIAVELANSHKLIGNVYLGKRDFDTFEIGYVFNRHYHRQGYAHESCRKVIGEAFSGGAHRIYAECDTLNESSWRLLEALGFKREAFFKSNVYFWQDENGAPIWKDTYVYSLLNSDI